MGKGKFLMQMAALHPEINYMGIEMYSSVLLRAIELRQAREAEGEILQNLYFRRMDGRLLPECFAPGEVERIYLNFSDPWPKSRHRSRRLPSREFLARYQKVLAPKGQVEFKTDNVDLFSFALFEARDVGWQILYETYDLHRDLAQGFAPLPNVLTEYEEKFVAQGKPICKLVMEPPTQAH